MMEALRLRNPGAPLRQILTWYFFHFLSFVLFWPFYRFRAFGIHNVPRRGAVLIVSNHQSFYDPMAIGIGCHARQFYALARSTLFTNPVFGAIIRTINCVPVEQGEGDIGAMRKCLGLLEGQQALLLFPEGSRSLSGKTERFQPGVMLLIKRAKPMVLPVAVEGAFAAWPRNKALPRLSGRIAVQYGKPIAAEELLAMGSGEAMKFLQERVERMRLELAERLRVMP